MKEYLIISTLIIVLISIINWCHYEYSDHGWSENGYKLYSKINKLFNASAIIYIIGLICCILIIIFKIK